MAILKKAMALDLPKDPLKTTADLLKGFDLLPMMQQLSPAYAYHEAEAWF
jgi:hypothetical protein